MDRDTALQIALDGIAEARHCTVRVGVHRYLMIQIVEAQTTSGTSEATPPRDSGDPEAVPTPVPDAGTAAPALPTIDEALREATPRIRSQARRIAIESGADEDDLHQEGLIAATQAYERFDPEKGASLTSWLVTKAIYGMRDALRAELGRGGKKHAVARPASLDADEAQPPARNDDATQALEADDELDGLRERFDAEAERLELSDRDRRLFELRMDGLTMAAVAGELGLSESRVCQIENRVKRELADPPGDRNGNGSSHGTSAGAYADDPLIRQIRAYNDRFVHGIGP